MTDIKQSLYDIQYQADRNASEINVSTLHIFISLRYADHINNTLNQSLQYFFHKIHSIGFLCYDYNKHKLQFHKASDC